MGLKKKEKIERVNEFHCCEQVFTHTDFIKHLYDAHGFVRGTQCARSLIQALDGSDFYSNIFEWSIPCGDKTVKAQQVSSGPRSKGDMMSDEDE